MTPHGQVFKKTYRFLPLVFIGLLCTLSLTSITKPAGQAAAAPPCATPGWFPTDFSLKDHSIFWYNGYYYIVSIHEGQETYFVYGRSRDLCTWQELDPILTTRTAGSPDEYAIWAPFVYFEDNTNTYYMYYTGVGEGVVQSIMLATSRNPANPNSWEPQGVVFQPDHEGMVWDDQPGAEWANCRDPWMIRIGGTYYLLYSGLDQDGGIIGIASANSPRGPWQRDLGSLVDPEPGAMLESPALVRYDGSYYLFYNRQGVTEKAGEYYRISDNLFDFRGEQQPERPWRPGWAHEVWQDQSGDWYTSYLDDYSVTISPVTWDTYFEPTRPFMGQDVFHRQLPIVVSTALNYSLNPSYLRLPYP